MKKLFIILVIPFVLSCTGTEHPDNPASELYVDYLELKDALVDSDPELAQEKASDLLQAKESLEKVGGKTGEAMVPALETIAGSNDLEEQRQAFSSLSDLFIQYAEQQNGKLGEVYVQYCPMALNDKGAYWLSDEEEIMNPYFGDEMLHCGEVKRKIE